MKKLFVILGLLFPAWALASPGEWLNFNVDMNDLSVSFLGIIFGNMEGVGLYGSGSQIMGEMFRVFNAAVLALCSFLMCYIVVISTLATAQDGQLLGRKWSSLWVPFRAVGGCCLIVPLGSGYCAAQIIVMWLVLQGVGAANLVWGAALDYLNRGGNIVVDNIDMNSSSEAKATVGHAGDLLVSQVCMFALEQALKKNQAVTKKVGLCDVPSAGGRPYWCEAVPNFVNTADFVEAYKYSMVNPGASPEVQFPQFEQGDPYSQLNGVCGSISWENFDESQKEELKRNMGGASDTLLEQAVFARTLGVQQMYINLAPTARKIVNNQYNPNENYHALPLGIPSPKDPSLWISPHGGSTLLNGNETLGAASAYQSILAPTMKALQNNLTESIEFIPDAKRAGWVMAGSYYFELSQLNKLVADTLDSADKISPDIGDSSNLITNTEITRLINEGALAERDVNLITLLMHGGDQHGVDIPKEDSVLQYVDNTKQVQHDNQMQIKMPAYERNVPVAVNDKLASHGLKFGFGLAPLIIKTAYTATNTARSVISEFIKHMVITNFVKLILFDIIGVFTMVFQSTLALGAMGESNPLMILSKAGNNMITLSVDILVRAVYTAVVIAANTMEADGIVIAAVLFMVPIFLMLLGLMMTLGVMLALYLPLIPYLLFTLGAIAWIIGVIEAMVAAPIVALGVMSPTGDDVFGKGDRAIILLLNVFLRPSMMVIGFIAGIILSHVGIWMLNTGFGRAVGNAQAHLLPISRAIGMLFAFILYCYISVMIIQKSFTLIYHLPDKILRWLSGGIEEALGSGASQMVERLEGKMESSGQRISGGFESSGRTLTSVADRAGKK